MLKYFRLDLKSPNIVCVAAWFVVVMINVGMVSHLHYAHDTGRAHDNALTAVALCFAVAGLAALAVNFRLIAALYQRDGRAPASLYASEERFRALIEATSDWVWEVDREGRYTFVGPRTEDILGYSPHEMLGRRPGFLLRPEEWARVKAIMRPFVQARLPIPPFEAEVLHKSGRPLYLECTGLPILDANGELLGYRGADRDITARKAAQEALRHSEMRLAEAQAIARLGSGEWDVAQQSFTWSRGVYRILELDPLHVQPSFRHYWERVPASARRAFLRFCATARQGGQSLHFEHPLVFPDGREKCVQIRVCTVVGVDGSPRRILATIQDITEQQAIEQRLRASEGRLRAAVEHMPSLFHAFDELGRFVVWNAEWERVTGHTKAQMIGNPDGLARLFPDAARREAFWNEWQYALSRGGERTWDVTCADGTTRTILWMNVGTNYPIPGWSSWGVGKDITERNRMDAERNLLMAAIEQAVEIMVIADTEGRVEYCNPAFEARTGYRREEIIHQRAPFFDSDDSATAEWPNILPQLQRGDSWQGRLETRRKDGTTFFEDVTMFPVKDERGRVTNIVRVGRDVTQETQLQMQLQQRQRLEALGTLAGGVAHDFNNLLMPIMGFSELMLDRLAPDDGNRSYLQEILKASARARDIVRQMLMFGRQGEAECEPVQVRTALRDAMRLLRASIPSTVTIVEDIRTDEELVWADPTQIHQIVMNICTNAYQAIQGQAGTVQVIVDTAYATPDLEVLHPPLSAGRRYIRIRVIDDGCGMDHETAERIFDPFYTTKPFGQGTGLGLATVHGIVSGLRGAIWVRSEPGQGSEFTVYLPEYISANHPEPAFVDGVPLGHGERILLVDDEESVLSATQRLLVGLGYHVTATTNSLDARDRVAAAPDDFDLVLTDQTMPLMTGAELAAAVRSVRADLPIILITGFSDAIVPESARDVELQCILGKPFSKRELAAVVQQVFESQPKAVG